VIEQGFSNFASGFDGEQRSASYGFVIENTGDGTATDIRISISADDAGDNALATDSETIHVLRPGQRMGVGDEFYGDDLASDVARLDVQIGETSDPYWAEDVPDEGRLTADGVATSADDYSMTTTFTATSTFGVQVDNPLRLRHLPRRGGRDHRRQHRLARLRPRQRHHRGRDHVLRRHPRRRCHRGVRGHRLLLTRHGRPRVMVGVTGLEPVTSRV
jgi:hypothetical protein